MIVAPASSGLAAICSATWKPSRSGMLTSSRTSVKGRPARSRRPTACRAPRGRFRRPSARVCQRVNCVCRMRRLTALSSTISTGSSASSGSGAGSAGAQLDHVEAGGEVKGAAFAGLALDPDAPAHQMHQVRGNRQAQAGAAKAPRRRSIGLAEGFEDRRSACPRGMPIPVSLTWKCSLVDPSERASSRTSSITWPRSVNLMALPTRFVRTCWSRTGSPTIPAGTAGSTSNSELQPLLIRLEGQRLEHVAHQIAHRERDGFELQLARLDLREVEDVVEDRQQRVGRRLDGRRGSRAAARDSSVSRASSVMPMTPFIGVRISWLMLARNSLLARLASIALSRADDEIRVRGAQLRGARLDGLLELLLVPQQLPVPLLNLAEHLVEPAHQLADLVAAGAARRADRTGGRA